MNIAFYKTLRSLRDEIENLREQNKQLTAENKHLAKDLEIFKRTLAQERYRKCPLKQDSTSETS